MNEQNEMAAKVNDFLARRGLRANYLAQQTGISAPMLYCFKRGHRFLADQQLQRLRSWMDAYDQRLGGIDGEGVFENDAFRDAYQNQQTTLTQN